MARILQISESDYRIVVQPGGTITLDTGSPTGTVFITGDLVVEGNTITVNSINSSITDNILLLNNEKNPDGTPFIHTGITLGTAGIELDRGLLSNAQLLFDENLQYYNTKTATDEFGLFTFGTADGELVGIRTNSITTVPGVNLNLIGTGNNFVSVLGTVEYERNILDYTDFDAQLGPVAIGNDPDAITNSQAVFDIVNSRLQYYGPRRIIEGNTAFTAWDSSVTDHAPSRFTMAIDDIERGVISATGFKFDNLNLIGNAIQATNLNGNILLQPQGTGNVAALSDMSVSGNFDVLGDRATIKELNVIDDLRVTGNSYGTAPVVTNLLYVTMDGSDTNDGSAQDPTKACRTISGATKSPLYQAGSAIKVAPGRYLENNPISVKAYTSIIGSDLRTTSVEPINKTQDIFHVHSSCYLAQMQFLNGRSGIVDINIDRGAYAVSFPTFETIDVYKSPYIQNCTNQSGPWLYDGTMFVPNQTVQIPLVVGTTTFVNGQSTITVTTASNTILPGMSINTAPQNQGFFSARTLILANKQFIKEQVIKFIELTYPGFSYQKEKCSRDVGYIIENIIYDTTFGGNSKSIEAGLFYWDGVASVITGEITQTVGALNYILELMLDIISNATAPDLLSGAGTLQIKNINLTGGNIATASLTNNIGIVTNIISNNPSAAPTAYYSTGSELGLVSAEILMHENRLFIQKEISSYIDLVYSVYGYDKITCKRDLGYIIDALMYDMMFGSNYQSIVAARAYYRNNATVVLTAEKEATIAALNELKMVLLSYAEGNIIITSSINTNIDMIINIINNGIGAIPSYSIPSPAGYDTGFQNARNLINNNLAFVKAELIQFITTNHPTLVYDTAICQRDIGYLINAVYYDLTYGGNIQSLIAGRAYYGYTLLLIDQTEKIAILSAYEYLGQLLYKIALDVVVSPSQLLVTQVRGTAGSTDAATAAKNMIEAIRIIILNEYKPIIIEPNFDWVSSLLPTRTLILKDKNVISDNIITYIDTLYTAFNYDKILCERDVGLIVDAISQDILLGGNSKSIEAGLSYYSGNKLLIEGEQDATVTALSRMETIISLIVTNSTVTPTVGNTQIQIKKPFFSNGNISIAPLSRNIAIIKSIITNGAYATPVRYSGSGLFAATGVSADDVQQATTVLNVKSVGGSQYLIELDRPTVGVGTDSTLYFGYTTVYPAVEATVPDTWASRRVDPWGSMGGMLIDGAVVSDISPITSMVMDAYTQVNQGGRGIRVTNRGYAQLVSVFTIFSSIAVQVDNGGIASITNSNANFGEYCMVAKGYGPKEFSGTVYNPSKFAFNSLTNQFDVNENYPKGYFPYKQTMCIFVPDTDFRPHISLLLEVEPPVTYINEQGMPGFLSAGVTFATITEGDLILKDIDVSNMYVGQTIYLRDQYGNYSDPVSGIRYLPMNTLVTDIGPQTLYMNTPITISGGVVGNDGYFTLFTTGKAYYTILSSIISNNPTIKSDGDPIVANNGILPSEQVGPEIASLNFLKGIVQNVASNIAITANQSLVNQVILLSYNGATAATFIGNLLDITINIIQNGESVAPTIVKKGVLTTAYADAATIILANIQFFVEEVSAYITANTAPSFSYNETKCRRDVALICKNIAYDLQTGGNYNSVYSGLSYYSRPGTYHIVTIEENANNYDLFPDGALVNFYQRSYMSASGYLFEYVGAGTNYGALPQVGRVDPNQKNEVNMLDGGKVFFTSTDQNGDFRIGTGLVISQATGVLSGRTFQKSLYAEMTPFILAIEG